MDSASLSLTFVSAVIVAAGIVLVFSRAIDEVLSRVIQARDASLSFIAADSLESAHHGH